MTYIVMRSTDGRYVAEPYTSDPRMAHKFPTREAAQSHCCGNEYVVEISNTSNVGPAMPSAALLDALAAAEAAGIKTEE